ncbi:helix-turn-helix domain-containing protein [Reyranella sp.]|uniref:helix-turn-helix domain-containing protein n=1 Tax=Reyranella sp. TaxID=1929291 RepID=UPI003BAB9C09
MLTTRFATSGLPSGNQFDAWRDWYDAVFETTTETGKRAGFEAANSNWIVGGLTVSQVDSAPVAVARSRSFVRRSPVDHWVVTLSDRSTSEVAAGDRRFRVPPGVPFLLSLGQDMAIRRTVGESRMQILLSRDTFAGSRQLLDSAVGIPLQGPRGALLADFLGMVRASVPTLTGEEASRLTGAVQSMLEACLGPSDRRVEGAGKPMAATLMERVRKAVARHLYSPSLGAAKLCREAATSRSQLYRLLEGQGGVAQYIQRRRLSESFAILCDTSHDFSIGRVAEMLCFADASGFSRAFRREFGVTPKEVRLAALSGLPPAPPSRDDSPAGRFRDCLRCS